MLHLAKSLAKEEESSLVSLEDVVARELVQENTTLVLLLEKFVEDLVAKNPANQRIL